MSINVTNYTKRDGTDVRSHTRTSPEVEAMAFSAKDYKAPQKKEVTSRFGDLVESYRGYVITADKYGYFYVLKSTDSRQYRFEGRSRADARKFVDELYAAKDSASSQVKVGDIYEHSWGYDQTNYDFLIVKSVSPTGKTAKCQILKNHVLGENGFMSNRVIPSKTEIGNSFLMRIDGHPRYGVSLRGTYPIGGSE